MTKSIIMLIFWAVFIFLSYKFIKLNIDETQKRLKDKDSGH